MTLTHAQRTSNPIPEQATTPRKRTAPIIQAHLRVGAVDDPLEREADEVMRRVVDSLAAGDAGSGADATDADASRVLRSAARRGPVTPVAGAVTRIRRSTAGTATAEAISGPGVAAPVAGAITRIRRSAASTATPGPIGAAGGGLDADTESMLNTRIGHGRKLDASVRRVMEPRFGHDFGAVRIHDDGAAHELNARMSAEAFTVGNDIFLSPSAPDASTRAGQGLLAHELTHVVQQGGVVSRRIVRGTFDADDLKRMNPEGGNPKSDPPAGRPEVAETESDEEGDEEIAAEELVAERKTKAMRVAVGQFRAAHDRVHAKQKSRVNGHRNELAKLKGRVAIAASGAVKGGERAANVGKHGGLNVGRSIGRLVGMDVKPNTSVKKATGANTTATAQGAYGAVDTEFIEPKFTVKLVGTTWHPILTNLKGTYGKITSPLPAGLAEVAGPDPAESKQQVKDLLNLDGSDWYMVKAVNAHESIHEDHVHDALNNVGNDIAQLFATLTVDQAAAPNEAAAIAAVKNLPGYNAIVNLANPNNSQIRNLWDAEYVNLIDRDHYGPTQVAEADVVEPMIDKINSWRKKSKLKKVKKKWTCTDGSDALHIPKGRKNP
jgi:Domain of unknown function (DUF4157)